MGAFSEKLRGSVVGVVGVCVFVGFAVVLGVAAFWGLGSNTPLIFPICASLFLAVVTPMTVIAVRHQVRLSRIKLIDIFAKTFGLSTRPLLPLDGAAAPDLTDPKTNVSFEFVKGKYYVDLDLKGGEEPKLEDLPRFPMMLHADWMLLLCALPFMGFSAFGVFILFAPAAAILTPGGSINAWLWPSMLALGGLPSATIANAAGAAAQHLNVLTVASVAFAGAYFYCLRLLLRAVASFDLSPVTFLRAFAHMVMATTLAVVIYRVFPSAEGVTATAREFYQALSGGTVDAATAVPDAAGGVKSFWLILSFALGFVPEAAIQYALQKAGFRFKARYDEVETHARTIPVTILDGVDSPTAFRLEESNVFEVQNLATLNPIMLHIESPFGIYQTIDWVAQAQLCTVVGPERFLHLKMLNIRTIFDLERATLSEFGVDELKNAVGVILAEDCARDQACRKAFGLPSPAASTAWPANAVAHHVRIMVDDLHVHRLRQIWLLIARQLGEEHDHLKDTAPPPPRAPT
ncbi:hypothetical protein JOD31_001042 [Methylopila capsulata]|uniref:Transmembrane protein n=1 Tax=Methylopila capsulata TaxID=61654 RepID=A0A9W6IVL3_9HYPH|nr:hypothetical protein [Methylopila capsulata]MBM7850830.1 hypothetical protein [Methylopila capsulata]GLK56124.1 hypothetical protein GCM10008170_21430 [Methylopila capsulata]